MLEILFIVACFIPIFALIFLCYSLGIAHDELKRRNWRFTLREFLIVTVICSLVLAGCVVVGWFVFELPPKGGF